MILHLPIFRALGFSGAVFGLGPVLGLFLLTQQPHLPDFQRASVTGRVTYENRPVTGTMVYFSLPGDLNTPCGMLQPDGSFDLQESCPLGTAPGEYRLHFVTSFRGRKLPAKFHNHDTSGLVVRITPGWNHVQIDLK
jgi:hypothetical protein